MSKSMDENERRLGLFRTPPHIVKALLKREQFRGTISDPATGRGDIVRVLRECRCPEVHAADKHDWNYRPCRIEDFLESTTQEDNFIINPPFLLEDCPNIKLKFLMQAKKLARCKIAMLFPLRFADTVGFVQHNKSDTDFPLKAIYTFPQTIHWLNDPRPGGKLHFGWFVFERGHRGPVVRKPIMFRKNARSVVL
jgi:hypothetical protein